MIGAGPPAVGAGPVVAPELPAPPRVVLSGDGVPLSPREHAALLARLCSERDVTGDEYLLGGEVAAFERQWAKLLGKDTAVFMPSGRWPITSPCGRWPANAGRSSCPR